MLLKCQPRAPEPILESVGVGGISETKRNEKTLCLVASATTPRLGTLAVEGQHAGYPTS
jgi:hypothetical protein